MKRTLIALALFASVAMVRAEVFQIGLNSTNDLGGLFQGIFEAPTPNNSTATGGEVGVGISYDNATRILDFNVAYGLFGFEPLQGDYTVSHIHRAEMGVSGGVVIDLAPIHTPVGPKAGFYTGSFTLTPEQETWLFNNELYGNIHSTDFPAGEIRAQLIPTVIPEPSLWALAGLGLATLVVFRKR